MRASPATHGGWPGFDGDCPATSGVAITLAVLLTLFTILLAEGWTRDRKVGFFSRSRLPRYRPSGRASRRARIAASASAALAAWGRSQPMPERRPRQRKRTSRPFKVNLFCRRPAQPDRSAKRNGWNFSRRISPRREIAPPAQLRKIYKSFVDDDPMLEMLLSAGRPWPASTSGCRRRITSRRISRQVS